MSVLYMYFDEYTYLLILAIWQVYIVLPQICIFILTNDIEHLFRCIFRYILLSTFLHLFADFPIVLCFVNLPEEFIIYSGTMSPSCRYFATDILSSHMRCYKQSKRLAKASVMAQIQENSSLHHGKVVKSCLDFFPLPKSMSSKPYFLLHCLRHSFENKDKYHWRPQYQSRVIKVM